MPINFGESKFLLRQETSGFKSHAFKPWGFDSGQDGYEAELTWFIPLGPTIALPSKVPYFKVNVSVRWTKRRLWRPGPTTTRCHRQGRRRRAFVPRNRYQKFPANWDRLEVRKVVFAAAFPIHIRRGTMQPAAEGVGVPQFNLDHLHAQLIHLLRLIDL